MKEIIRMNQLAGIITEGQAKKMMRILNENDFEDDETNPDFYDVNPNWNEIKVLGTEEDPQGEWVIFADPNDPYLEKEGYSFAVLKQDIEQVANGEEIGVSDGSSISMYMNSQNAKNILSQI